MLTVTAVTAPASTYDLTLLATVKAELGITDRDEDENLARWIKQASEAIAKFCNRVFAQETLTDTFRFKLRDREEGLALSRFPVTDLASVVENDTTLDASDYELSPLGGVLIRLRNDHPWLWRYGKVVATYTAGYERVADLPFGIERAAIILVNQYRYAATRDPLLRSEQTQNIGSSSYYDHVELAGFSPELNGLLDKYRKPSNG